VAQTRQRQAGLVLAIAGWAFILVATLVPAPDQAVTASDTSVWCLVCGELGLVDVTLNLLLFIPLGLGLGLLGVRWQRALLFVALTTLAIEVLQLSVITGRDASLSDLVTNTLGGGLGIALGRWWPRVLFPSRRASFVIAGLGAAGWLGVQAFTGFALQRTLPRSVYYGQWSPALAQFEQFTGRVVSVRLDSIPLPGTRLSNSRLVRETLLAPQSVLEARAVTGQPTADVAPIFSIFDERQREIILLGQDGTDLIFRVRTRTGPLGLRSPALRLAHALPPEAGTRIELRARYEPGHYRLDAEVGGTTYSRELALSASWGWTFLLPFTHSFGAEMPWLTVLWVGGLLLPLGYYGGRSGVLRGSVGMVLLLALLGAGLVLIPLLASFAAWHPLEWAAGLTGGLAGFRLGTRSCGQG
jgi:hypothetical protein